MRALEILWAELLVDGSVYLVCALVPVFLLVRLLGKRDQRRGFVRTLTPFALHLLCTFGSWAALLAESPIQPFVRLAATIFAAITAVSLAAMALFMLLLPRVGILIPRILRDAVVGVGAVAAALVLTSRAGFDVTGLAATSAILTAVIALSLQDTLGNIVAGLALELDHSPVVGDWITVEQITGQVREIRWRHSAVETRNGETLIVPNSALVKSRVMVLGRHSKHPGLLRRWVRFNVDFRFPPSEVIAAVLKALKKGNIPCVAKEPAPDCLLMELDESYARYAVRYWLKDLVRDDPTDSAVRTRIFYGLKRGGFPLSIPAQAVFMTNETSSRKTEKLSQDLERRAAILAGLPLFADFSHAERLELAQRLHESPYGPGELLTRQGDVGHWLYIIAEGDVSVRVRCDDGQEREVGRLGAGSFFGEAALLTDVPRTATVEAVGEVACFRLSRVDFQEAIKRRPDMKEVIARIMAERQVRLFQLKEGEEGGATKRLERTKTAFLARMRRLIWPEDA